MTSGANAAGRCGKQGFVYVPEADDDRGRVAADLAILQRGAPDDAADQLQDRLRELPDQAMCTNGKERRIDSA